jgi:transposase
MLFLIIVGGSTLMMGQHTRSESLFYYFRLEDQVPENHLLRLIDRHIDFGFVREQLKDSYSDTGRPSIDPELLLRIVLIGYLYGISNERKLVEELRMHLAWRWFTGLGFDQEIPHHSTFSKNRHGRFQESKLFQQMFERVVARCLEVGLVRGDQLSVDGRFVEANASKESRIPREELAEAAQVNRTVREWLAELEAQNPVKEAVQYNLRREQRLQHQPAQKRLCNMWVQKVAEHPEFPRLRLTRKRRFLTPRLLCDSYRYPPTISACN